MQHFQAVFRCGCDESFFFCALMDSIRWKLTFICVHFFTFFSSSGCDSWDLSPGWVRVCTAGGEHYQTTTTNCPMGVFLLEPMIPGCVCMHGTWVLHSTLCDNAPYIFHGENEKEQCYQIDFNISMFVYLGDPSDITARYEGSRLEDHLCCFIEIFNEIVDDGSSTPLMDFYWPSIVAVNPSKSIMAAETGKSAPTCFSTIEFVSKKMKVRGHIWDGARGPTSYKMVDSCKGARWGGYDHLIGTSDNFFYRSNKAVPVPFTPCSSACKGTKRKRRSLEGIGISLEEPTGRDFPETLFGRRRRQKRYKTRDTVESTWEGLGFCMTSYWDPLLKFEMSTTEEMRCYPQNKGIKPA